MVVWTTVLFTLRRSASEPVFTGQRQTPHDVAAWIPGTAAGAALAGRASQSERPGIARIPARAAMTLRIVIIPSRSTGGPLSFVLPLPGTVRHHYQAARHTRGARVCSCAPIEVTTAGSGRRCRTPAWARPGKPPALRAVPGSPPGPRQSCAGAGADRRSSAPRTPRCATIRRARAAAIPAGARPRRRTSRPAGGPGLASFPHARQYYERVFDKSREEPGIPAGVPAWLRARHAGAPGCFSGQPAGRAIARDRALTRALSWTMGGPDGSPPISARRCSIPGRRRPRTLPAVIRGTSRRVYYASRQEADLWEGTQEGPTAHSSTSLPVSTRLPARSSRPESGATGATSCLASTARSP